MKSSQPNHSQDKGKLSQQQGRKPTAFGTQGQGLNIGANQPPHFDANSLTPSNVMALQRLVGNAVVQRMLSSQRGAIQRPTIQRDDTEEDEVPSGQPATPSNATDGSPYKKHGINAEYQNRALKDSAATDYKLSVIVWRPGEHYLPIQKARAWSTARNRIRGFPVIDAFTRKPKNTEQIKNSAPLKVARKQPGFKNQSAAEQKKAIKAISDHADRIGHTWVRLNAYVGDTLKESSSWGFWPKEGFTNPTTSVRGEVREYDHMHDKESNVKALDSQLSAKKYDAGVGYAASMIKNPPRYQLSGFNCTKFAKKMADAVGGRFPGNGEVFPAEPAQGFFQRIFSPDSAYASLEKKKDSYEGKDLEKIPRSGFVMSLNSAESESEETEDDSLELPKVRSVYKLGKDLIVEDYREREQTILAGKLIMVTRVAGRDEIEVESAREGQSNSIRGTTNIKGFYNAEPVPHQRG